jgi:uncharacterized protein
MRTAWLSCGPASLFWFTADHYGLYALLDFYESYRAFVRAKVSSFLAHDTSVQAETRSTAEDAARRHFLLALSASRPPLVRPRLIVCMGMIASGKSSLAEALATALGAAVLSSDRVRKRLLDVPLTRPVHDDAFAGGYAPELSERVYALLRERAALILRSSRSVILDATFREQSQREQLGALAEQLGVELYFLDCACTRACAMEGLRLRAQTASVSDGRAEIYDDVASRFEQASELPPSVRLALDTNQSADQTRAQALRWLGSAS